MLFVDCYLLFELCLKKIILILFVFAIAAPQFSYADFGETSTYLGKIYSGDGKSSKFAYFDGPKDFVKDKKGNFYIVDTTNNVIRKIEAKTKRVSALAGTGDFGSRDGIWNKATFSFPEGIDMDSRGNVYIADTASGKIRKYDKNTGVVYTLFSDLRQPKDAMIRGNELYIADTGNNRILRSNTAGTGLTTAVKISLPRKLAWDDTMPFVASKRIKGVIGISLTSGQKLTLFRKVKDFGGLTV